MDDDSDSDEASESDEETPVKKVRYFFLLYRSCIF